MERGEPVALATIIASKSPAGGLIGAKLLVTADGIVAGNLPDQGLSRAVEADCLSMLREGISGTHQYPNLPLTGDETTVFVDVTLPAARLVIAGAGHIAQPLAKIAKMVGFEVIVADDRASFANRQRFPDADQVVVAEFDEFFSHLTVTANTYIVLVTRGHQHDETCLRHAVGGAAAYIGMIGSRRRIRSVFEELVAGGVAGDDLDRVYAPIGLDIGAQTPEEIAVSIVAELIKVRRRGRATSLASRRSQSA